MTKTSVNIHKEWVKELKNGSYSAFNELYAIYADLLYGFVLNLTKSPSEAKDVVQESFLKIWETKSNISLDLSFKAYLYTIARNLVIDSFRKQINNVSFEHYINSDYYQKQSENNIEREINYDEFIQKLENAKLRMSEVQRLIFELNKEQGLSISEVAEKTKLSNKTIRNNLTLIVKMLRAEFAGIAFFLSLHL